MFEYELFIKKLKEHRMSLNFTIEELASKAEIDCSTLKRIENGESIPNLTTFISILNAFHTNTESFLSDTEPEKNNILIENIISIMRTCSCRERELFLKIIRI